MKAYILKTGTTIAPFGDDVSETQVLNRNLCDLQSEYLRLYGFEPLFIEKPEEAKERPCLFLFDYVFFSESVLKIMLEILKENPKNAALALQAGLATNVIRPVAEIHEETPEKGAGRLVFDMFFLKDAALPDTSDPAELRRELIEKCGRVVVPARARMTRKAFATSSRGEFAAQIPITARAAAHVQHWVHILWLNHLMLSVNFVDYVRHHPWRFFGTMFHERLKCFLKNLFTLRFLTGRFTDYNIYKLLARMVFMGKDCNVHPTAYLENVWLGDGVVIGPSVNLRNSFVGSGVQIFDNAYVASSVIGENCTIQRDSFFTGCVAYPGSILGNIKNQICLLGREIFLTSGAYLLDAKLGGTVKVEHRGRMVDTGVSYIGSCIGHRVILGFDVAIEPGRAIPNDSRIVQTPGRAVRQVPTDLTKDWWLYVKDGTLKEYPR